MKQSIISFLRMLVVAVLIPAGLTGCATIRDLEVGASHQLFPPEVEEELGDEFHGQITEDFTLVNDPQARRWLDRVGYELVSHSPETEQDFNFYLTDSMEVNAFAIPGGHCYVNMGLVLYCDNEAQVASVIGHEINHVTRRHGLLRMQRMMGLQTAQQLAGSASGSTAVQAGLELAAQGGGYLAIQRFSRDDEREADILGVRAIHGAGYDPGEAVRFFEKLNALHGSGQPSYLENWLSTHPATLNRVNYLTAEIQNLPRLESPIVNTSEFENLQDHLRGIYGEGPGKVSQEEAE